MEKEQGFIHFPDRFMLGVDHPGHIKWS